MAKLTLDEFRKRGQEARKKKITPEQLQEWGRRSVQKRLAGMTPEQKSEYFKKIRRGEKVTPLPQA